MTVKNSSCMECGGVVIKSDVCRMCGNNDRCVLHMKICKTCGRGVCKTCECNHHDSGHGVISIDGKITWKNDN